MTQKNTPNALSSKIGDLGKVMAGESIRQIPLSEIVEDPNQPRRNFPEEPLKRLAASIEAQGVQQPIILRRSGNQLVPYIIAAGARRYRASKIAGKSTIPAVVREMDDLTILAVQIIENIHREDVSAWDQALAIKSYMDHFTDGGRGSRRQAAESLGFSEATISERLTLLNLPPEVQQAVESGSVTDASTAVALSRVLEQDKTAGLYLVDKAQNGGVSREEVREVVKKVKAASKRQRKESAENPERDPNTSDMFGGNANDTTAENSDKTPQTGDGVAAFGDNPKATNPELTASFRQVLDSLPDGAVNPKNMAVLVREIRAYALAHKLNWEEILAGATYDKTDNEQGAAENGGAA